MEEWQTLSSRVAYENPWLRLREDRVRRPSGSQGTYGYVEKPPYVVILPFDGARLYLVNQFRYPIRRRTWELPQGTAESDDLAANARKELREETGLEAGRLTLLGALTLAGGFCAQRGQIFLAEELRQGAPALEESEEGLYTAAFSAAQVEHMIRDGAIDDSGSIAAYARWRLL